MPEVEGTALARGLNQATLTVLGRYGGKRGQQALAVAAAAQVATPFVKWAKTKLERSEDFTITVAGVDEIYADLHEWVLARIPESDRKALIAATPRSRELRYEGEPEQPAPRVRLRYDGSKTQSVTLDGHKLTVTVARDDIPGGRESLPENWRAMVEKITFTAASAGGRDAIVRMMDGLLAAKHGKTGPPPLLVPSRYGGSWNRRGDLPPRTLDSIVLKGGQLERLVDDLATFLASEQDYARVCQPWHRGYLFHGSPGTGKTSVARALANHFSMPIYYLPLGDLEKDADLMSLVGAIEPRSVLLLEDADVFHATTDRGEEAGTASVASMLNALDGIWTPHGLVTVLTTNDRDALDAALIREGRIDVDEEFTALDVEQGERLAVWLEGDEIGSVAAAREFNGQSPAALIGALRDRSKLEARSETVPSGERCSDPRVRGRLESDEQSAADALTINPTGAPRLTDSTAMGRPA